MSAPQRVVVESAAAEAGRGQVRLVEKRRLSTLRTVASMVRNSFGVVGTVLGCGIAKSVWLGRSSV
jgi:hypothetical protein